MKSGKEVHIINWKNFKSMKECGNICEDIMNMRVYYCKDKIAVLMEYYDTESSGYIKRRFIFDYDGKTELEERKEVKAADLY